MKKIAIVLAIALSSGMSEASQDQYVAQEQHEQLAVDKYPGQYTQDYANIDEYTNNEQEQCTIDEYDQQICDTVQPPAVSNTQIFLASIAGKMLLYYMILQQTATMYLHEIKDFLAQWIHNISKL